MSHCCDRFVTPAPGTVRTPLVVYGSVIARSDETHFFNNTAVAIPAPHRRFSMFCNHCDFPSFLALEIFEFVNAAKPHNGSSLSFHITHRPLLSAGFQGY